MTQARLIICPQSPYNAPSSCPDIKHALTELGLMASEFADNTYYAGNDFISLIPFLGCSPNIQLTPDGDNAFCYLKISDISESSQHLGHGKAFRPKCPNCKAKIQDWKDTENWQSSSSEVTCIECNTSSALCHLKWSQEGGYGRFCIIITNIHAHEAVPSDKVFQTLKNTTGFEWTYLYANNET